MDRAKTGVILQQVAETLATAEFGLKMVLSADPAHRRIGVRNLIVFGRAVTNVLQQLRSATGDFDAWYGPWVERMRGDPIMALFYRLRSEILKEGRLQTRASVSVDYLNTAVLMAIVPRPPRAESFFIGDQNGGSGWEIELPSGEAQKFYVELRQGVPGVEFTVDLHLAGAPQALKNAPVEDLCRHYFELLRTLCDEAKQHFGS